MGTLTQNIAELNGVEALTAWPCPANSLLFTVHSRVSKSSTCMCSRCGAARIFAHDGHFFVAGARETSCFGGPKSTFCDRCKGSVRFYVEMQISLQVQHFGHEGW